ncbi:Meckel syndrome type 1-like protein [Labeo rohita]|uniref:Meckel syndrome type 1-like protein n=1 Tax=Labeo rohita TaxID=84645 RepID=A0A498MCY4_LABRO|nr:Meckel syndrome type 1-like protein [Labeo rohita]
MSRGLPGSLAPGQDVFDRLSLLLYCRELLGEVLDSVAEEAGLGDGSVEKACFVDICHLRQVQPEVAFLDHERGHHLTRGPRGDRLLPSGD